MKVLKIYLHVYQESIENLNKGINMKIKLSKSDWELIGQKTGWIKEAQ